MEKIMRILLLEPNRSAKVVDIEQTLEGMQKVVDGDIEAVYPFNDNIAIVCNKEAKINGLNGLPANRAIVGNTPVEQEMSYGEMTSAFRAAEASGKHMTGYIVISSDSFDKPYSAEARTYEVSSDNKAFQANMGGYSIYGSAIDGSDPMVRLERYLAAEKGGADGWKIERCYVLKPDKRIIDILFGTCFICGVNDDSFISLTDEQIQKYEEMFRYPETFVRAKDGSIGAWSFLRDLSTDEIKNEFPVGTRIHLVTMWDDLQPVPPGTEGTVSHVDDAGTIHMRWDTGSSLGLIYGKDTFYIVPAKEDQE